MDVVKRGRRRIDRVNARGLKERGGGFSSLDIFESFAESTATQEWAEREWHEAVKVIVPYAARKELWPSCSPQAQKEFYRRNWHRIRENQKRYYRAHRAEHNARVMAWARRNRDKVLARRRELYALNAERERARQKRWRDANRRARA